MSIVNHIDLSDNRLNLKESNVLNGLTALKKLNLAANLITKIEILSFVTLKSLQKFDQSDNLLNEIFKDSFK